MRPPPLLDVAPAPDPADRELVEGGGEVVAIDVSRRCALRDVEQPRYLVEAREFVGRHRLGRYLPSRTRRCHRRCCFHRTEKVPSPLSDFHEGEEVPMSASTTPDLETALHDLVEVHLDFESFAQRYQRRLDEATNRVASLLVDRGLIFDQRESRDEGRRSPK